MATQPFFTYYPTITYAGYAATNIMQRIAFVEKYRDNFQLFAQYTIPDGKRADSIAYDVYGSCDYTWIIYMFNNIIDPIFQWPLNTQQFEDFIINKYGSVPAAMAITQYYQNNWPSDPSTLDPTGYSLLATSHKKYYSPILRASNIVAGYKRKQLDTIVNSLAGIPADERSYFSPVTAYDYEVQLNNDKAQIKLLKPQYINGVQQSLQQAFK